MNSFETIKKVLTEIAGNDIIFSLDQPEDASHGDYATNIAFPLSKKQNISPKSCADNLIKELEEKNKELELAIKNLKLKNLSWTEKFKIDEDALFYLRSRGLSVDSATNLLMNAFAGDVVNTVKIEVLKDYVDDLIQKSLEK